MAADTLIALLAFAFVASWTPGANNTLLAASGLNFGLRRTLPHVAGVVLGFTAMVFAVALGLGELYSRIPWLEAVLAWVGALVLLWFSWRIAMAGSAGGKRRSRPFTFLEAAGFQWINPKAWTMSSAIITQFAGVSHPLGDAFIFAGAFLVAGATATLAWAAAGSALQRWLHEPWRLQAFNYTMAGLLASFVLTMLLARW